MADERTPVALQLGIPLPPLQGVADISPELIDRSGGTRPFKYLSASNGSDYYCKGPSLHIPPLFAHPYVGVNEFVVGHLARALGIPARAIELIEWKGELFVGIELLPNDRKITGPLDAANWQRLINAPAVAYDVVVLDAWTLNTDRHPGNWLGRILAPGRGLFMVNDHDMALLGLDCTPVDLLAASNAAITPAHLRTSEIRASVTSRPTLEAAIARARALPAEQIANLVGRVPSEWLDDTQKGHVIDFLVRRRDRLAELFGAASNLFPMMEDPR